MRARSKRGSIGEQWWSRRFIDVLESFGMTGRLSRGRNYARRGQVIAFEISVRVRDRPGAGFPAAAVPGADPGDARSPRRSGGGSSRRSAGAGAVPGQAAGRRDAARDRGSVRRLRHAALPAPRERHGDVVLLPGLGVPCKHLAAVCYVLAEAFDADPFGLLAWRGRGREDLLASLRGLTAAGPPAPRPVIDVADRPLAECMADFWSPGMSQARLRSRPAVPAAPPGLLLRTFEPPPVLVRGARPGRPCWPRPTSGWAPRPPTSRRGPGRPTA